MSQNYIEHLHEHYSPVTEDGVRVKAVDVWYAIQPTAPSRDLIDAFTEEKDPDVDIELFTPWTVYGVGHNGNIPIHGREDIAGLRGLLDKIEEKFDIDDFNTLTEPSEVGNIES